VPKIRRLTAFDENDLPVGVVTVQSSDQEVPENLITWTCSVGDCITMGARQSSTANAVASLENHLALIHHT
jgi:hypothetical protein